MKPPEDEEIAGEYPTGEVGEVRSFEPDVSFVRIFLRNPRVGMRRSAGTLEMAERGTAFNRTKKASGLIYLRTLDISDVRQHVDFALYLSSVDYLSQSN